MAIGETEELIQDQIEYNLVFIGPDSASLGEVEIEFLGKLLGAILYGEIHIASKMLFGVHTDLVIDIKQASNILRSLAGLCYDSRKGRNKE